MATTAEYRQGWRAKNPTKAAEYARDYRQRHPERVREQRRQYREAHPEKVLQWRASEEPEKKRAAHLRRTFGISLEEYDERVRQQDGVCAICGQPENCRGRGGAVMPLTVDHNHETNSVRGLLCRACNVALGLMNDSATTLRAAADYLDRWEKA
jgi:hypothetical protein